MDAGGLFKEFIETMCKNVFAPDYGIFKCNKDEKL